MKKATQAGAVTRFAQIPNVGRAVAADFVRLGLHTPQELARCDPLALYRQLGALTGKRPDPCVLDTFIAACNFMRGNPAQPWYHYTPERKRRYPDL